MSPKATEKFSEIGSLILEEFAECVEEIMEEEKTRVMPRHIEQAHSRFLLSVSNRQMQYFEMRNRNGTE